MSAQAIKGSTYYIALDGLRAVAVIMVFFQHYGAGKAWIFGWGWAGVDIFFVLSGFLITGILFDSQHKPHRYRDFYVRRTLRIFPLYYALWFVFLVLAPIAKWEWNARWALWPAYLGNYARFFFLHQRGNPYRFDRLSFGVAVNGWFGGPMHLYIGHFWSLCVEEQFYLIWPFVVYQVRRREALIRICIACIVVMPLLRWLLTIIAPAPMLAMELLYRSLPTRLDALLMGGLIALLLRGPERQLLQKMRHTLLALAAALLAGLFFASVSLFKLAYFGSASNWVAILGFTLIDLFAAGLILAAIHPGSLLGRALSFKPLRSLGVISYGFYVYHDLLHDFYAYAAHRWFPGHVFQATVTIAFAATLAIAGLSYYAMEKPMLRLKSRFSDQVHMAPAS